MCHFYHDGGAGDYGGLSPHAEMQLSFVNPC